jgi:(1->4)-alpha-D-glucan 1-alpha-D-glucosylmutase
MKRRLARLVASHPVVCDAVERVAASLGGNPGEPASFTPLHRLLEAQHYRLAYWRVAADEINYRRFFDISELAALRMEREEVFEATHERVLDWVRRGCIDGLRIDHVDGLADPRAYLERLRAHFPDAQRYLFVEKILGDGETLRDWPVDGTTGYEFLNLVNGLFVDTRGRGKFERLHRHVTGDARSFDEILSASKRHVIRTLLASEIEVLAGGLERLAERDWHTRDFTLSEIRRALEDLVVCFPVYRSYVDARGAGPQDRRIIGEAVGAARALSGDPESDLFVWLERVLAADLVAPAPPSARRRELLRLVCRFQQYTAPVMAKGFEDTALYREHVLLSLNEVGGDPRRFGVSVDAFHEANRERARRWPRSLLTTSTHDTKRGEDVRARLDVLSEIPDHWRDQVRRWMRLNRGLRRRVAGELVPHPKDEYLLYQTLLGSWPASELGGVVGVQADYLERIGVYLVKAMREGKERTSWRHARQDYERAVLDFAGRILAPASAFLGEFRRFQAEVAQAGALTSLAQLVLKLTVPGVPDIYQGCELWDLSLADPDNRRGVDFAKRRSWLTEVEALDPAQPGILEGLLSHWHDGRIKLFVTRRLLALRSRHPGLFARGEYVSLEPRGKAESRVCAFARRGDDEPTLLVVVARLCAELARPGGVLFPAPDEWADTALTAPDGGPWRDVLTGSRLDEGGRVLTVARLFQRLPFAVLIAEP